MRKITVIPGDGIGSEVTQSALSILRKLNIPLTFEIIENYRNCDGDLSAEAIESIEKNRVVLKGPLTTEIGKGKRSLNVHLRKHYNLYANIRPIKSITPLGKFPNVDYVIFRENTEGLYIGIEHEVSLDKVIAEKVCTREASIKIAKAAFDFAIKHKRERVTVVHKANILKLCDGLFLSCVREVSKAYPSVILNEMIVDNAAMQSVLNPYQFDVIVTMNLYGDILSDLGAGLIGGLGLTASANMGLDMAVFEAVHGTAPDIAGKNLANPTAMILSSALMLEHLGYTDEANSVREAIKFVLSVQTTCTRDLGGPLSTEAFTQCVIENLKQ